MVQSFATTTDTNDIFIGGDGNLAVATGVQAVTYACGNAAKAQRGEMIFQINEGIPNFQLLWNGSPNIPQWTSALQAALESVPGVEEVLSINTTRADSVLEYTATILTTFGAAVLNGEF